MLQKVVVKYFLRAKSQALAKWMEAKPNGVVNLFSVFVYWS